MNSQLGTLGLLLWTAALAVGQNLDASTIESMGNNSLFTRWRPRSHFIAPAGWMNVRINTAKYEASNNPL